MPSTTNRTAAAKRAAAMRELRAQGLPLEEIGERYGIGRERVRQIIGNTGRIGVRRWRRRPTEAA